MRPSGKHTVHSVENDLIKAVLYPFAMCDYEGMTGITLKSISSSDLFERVHIDVVNMSLDVSQRAELIEWDGERIGGIRPTKAGVEAFMQVRDEFFDADALLSFKERLEGIEMVPQAEATDIIRAKAGDCCPRSGVWQSLEETTRHENYQAGELMHDLRSPYGLTVWIWVRD